MTDLKGNLDIAVVGMSCRFPGASDVNEFWRNLRDGVESITLFSDEQLRSFGVSPIALQSPNFVKAGAILEGTDLFDAAFFGYSPREAELLDPQHRIFLECAWQALENAGYSPSNSVGLIGVYAGTSLSTYLLYNLLASSPLEASEDGFQVMIGNDKDFLSTRVSYELNLRGPSVDVQTGCSTSLVAVHLACQGLLSYQCDMALAGGVSVQVPQRTGYYYQEGGISSPDGHCRAFDAKAQGTIFGSGVGIVVLKRYTDAIVEGDEIHAVIKGSAINNDGSSKIGFTAPSVDGQAQVVALAQIIAGVEPETITYVETHGTGTALGDPVEVAALTKAFRSSTNKKNFCALGSVKVNIGHLDAAAGVAGFIKTVLSLKHKMIPPTLHFQEPNPKIDFANSPFYVNAKLSEWKASVTPRRAGISSFGIGGTNAHIIVEEAEPVARSEQCRMWKVLMLSAKTTSALDQMTLNLAEFLKQSPDANLADVAFTLQTGRKNFVYRRIAVCSSTEEAIQVLDRVEPGRILTARRELDEPQIIFMFPGGGAQHVNMGRDLYRGESYFRKEVDKCCELLKPMLGYDLRVLVYPGSGEEQEGRELERTSIGLPALFVIEYSLARLLMHWGIRPEGMIGHSLGEYTAACISGVFSVEDALSVVVMRGRLFEKLPKGRMLSVAMSEEEAGRYVSERVSVAAVNAEEQVVLSGSEEGIEEVEERLRGEGKEYRRIHIEVAGHSYMVEEIAREFGEYVSKLERQEPGIGFISNRTGKWIRGEEAKDWRYWERQLRETVRFAEGIEELRKEGGRLLVEVGPGQTLSTLAKMGGRGGGRGGEVVRMMRHPYERGSDEKYLAEGIGKLWMKGVEVDWERYYEEERRKRVGVGGYAFERQRYWIEAKQGGENEQREGKGRGKRADIGEWYYIPSWRRRMIGGKRKGEGARRWMVVKDEEGVGEEIAEELRRRGEEVIEVGRGEDASAELKKEAERGGGIDELVHCLSITEGEDERSTGEAFEQAQENGFYSLLSLAQVLSQQDIQGPLRLWVLSDGLHEIDNPARWHPEKATLLGACKVIPQEIENITCHSIDLTIPPRGSRQRRTLIEQLLREMNTESSEMTVAYRGDKRWVQTYEPVRLEGDVEDILPLRKKGVYLITGGLGGIGMKIAQYLAETLQARLILVGRSFFPEREAWDQWLEANDPEDDINRKIRKVQAMEQYGAEVSILRADVASEQLMQSVIAQTCERFGDLHGIIHAAGLAGETIIKLIPEVDESECRRHFQAKVYGLYSLEKAVAGRELDFCLLFSSNAAILGGIGSISYTAANLFMDAFACHRRESNGARWISANWDGWLIEADSKLSASFQTSLDQYAMTLEEGIEAFRRIVCNATVSNMVVSTGDLQSRLSLWIERDSQNRDPSISRDPTAFHPRPPLGTAYVPTSNEVEKVIANIWQDLLGIKQIGIYDNFFDLGGNSLIGIKAVSQLKQTLNVDIPIVMLFERPTVSALAKELSHTGSDQPSYEDNRSRGERRRERRRHSHQAAEQG